MRSYCVKALENTQSILCGLFLVCEHFCSGRTASHRTALDFRGIFVLLDAGGLSPAKDKRAKSTEKTGRPACVLLLIDAIKKQCGRYLPHCFFIASINKSTHAGRPVFSVLFALLSLAGDSPPASKRTKIPRKSKAVRCEAVLPEQKCSQTRKRPQRILCVFSRALTQYERISARQNRVCPCQSTLGARQHRRAMEKLISIPTFLVGLCGL